MRFLRVGRLARFLASVRPFFNLGTVQAGPHNVQVTRFADGAALGLSDALRASVIDLAGLHVEDPGTLASLLEDIWELDGLAAGRDSHARHELDARVDAFLELISAHEVRLYGQQVERLAALLWEARGHSAPVSIPAQREGGAAA
jgi:hypothetical protein